MPVARHSSQVFALDLSDDDATPALDTQRFRYVGVVIATDSVSDNTGEFAVEVRNGASPWVALDVDGLPALNDADANMASGIVLGPFDQVRVAFTAAGSAPDGTAQVFVTLKD